MSPGWRANRAARPARWRRRSGKLRPPNRRSRCGDECELTSGKAHHDMKTGVWAYSLIPTSPYLSGHPQRARGRTDQVLKGIGGGQEAPGQGDQGAAHGGDGGGRGEGGGGYCRAMRIFFVDSHLCPHHCGLTPLVHLDYLRTRHRPGARPRQNVTGGSWRRRSPTRCVDWCVNQQVWISV